MTVTPVIDDEPRIIVFSLGEMEHFFRDVVNVAKISGDVLHFKQILPDFILVSSDKFGGDVMIEVRDPYKYQDISSEAPLNAS